MTEADYMSNRLLKTETSKYALLQTALLMGLSFPACLAAANAYTSWLECCASMVFSGLVASFVLAIPSRIGKWVIGSICLCFSFIELVHTIVYCGDLASAGFIRSLFMTTPHESDGAVSVIIRQNVWYIIFLSAYYVGLSTIILRKELATKIVMKGALCTSLLSLILITIELTNGISFHHIVRQVPFNAYTQSIEAFRQMYERNTLTRSNANFSYRSIRDSIPEKNEVYVLIIDESLSYEHLSIGGYERETTPCLAMLDNIISYTDYTTSGVFTMYAVPMLITPATPSTFKNHYKMNGVQEAYRGCGFSTYWVTHYGQLVNDGVSTYLADGVDEIISVEDDADIPVKIDSLMTKHNKLFIIAHLWGSHQHYTNATGTISRYAPNRLTTRAVLGESIFVNSYDNTILYTDSIIGYLTNILERQDVIAQWIFVSDHGEGPINKNGGAHGYTTPKESEYHVPLMIWYNQQYAAMHPRKILAAKQHINNAICADHIFWSVLDMAGVKIDEDLQQEGMSIFGDTLLPHKRELLLPDGRTIMELQ